MGTLGIFALIVLLTLVATVLGAVVWLAMLPGKIAAKRQHPQADAIRMAGWLGIITGVVWIVAMIWAYTKTEAEQQHGLTQRIAELEQRLAAFERHEVITEGGTS